MQIKLANLARRAMRRKGLKPTRLIVDERQVLNVRTAYIWYSKDRMKSGDYKGMPVWQATKLIGAEWKATQPAERKARPQ